MKKIECTEEQIEKFFLCSSAVSSILSYALEKYSKKYVCAVVDSIGRFWALTEYPVSSNDVCWEITTNSVMELVEVPVTIRHFPFLSKVWNQYVVILEAF